MSSILIVSSNLLIMKITNQNLLNAFKNSHSVQNIEDIEFYDTTDEIILAAYNHVKNSKSKIENFRDSRALIIGLKSSDGKYFIGQLLPLRGGINSKLHRELRDKGVSLVDFINRQLMTFL